MKRSRILLLTVMYLQSATVLAWGERGHDTIARVAAHLLVSDEATAGTSLAKLFVEREHMLGHLANIPDIGWKHMGKEIDTIGRSTHFIDLEYILTQDGIPKVGDLPRNMAEVRSRISSNCSKRPASCATGSTMAEQVNKVGHAPFRVQQLSEALLSSFKELKKLESLPNIPLEQRYAQVQSALVNAGVLGHFVGDLSNPYHTTADYDGWNKDQGGLHMYWEIDMLIIQDLGLDQRVFAHAKKSRPARTLFAKAADDSLNMVWELIIDSFREVDSVSELDRRFALTKKSDSSKRLSAERKAPELVVDKFNDLLIARLAIGADALASFWKLAWTKAGKPDLSFYRTFDYYPTHPEFIPLDYDVK